MCLDEESSPAAGAPRHLLFIYLILHPMKYINKPPAEIIYFNFMTSLMTKKQSKIKISSSQIITPLSEAHCF